MRIVEELKREARKISLEDCDYEPIHPIEIGEEIIIEEITDEYKRMYILVQRYADELVELIKMYEEEKDIKRAKNIFLKIQIKLEITMLANEMLYLSLKLEANTLFENIGIRKGWKLIKTPMPDIILPGKITTITERSGLEMNKIIYPPGWDKCIN